MNELYDSVETLKAPEPTQKKSWIHHIPHEWLRLEEHEGNCDALPDRLTPKTGCPKCKAAWLSIVNVAFASTCFRGRLVDGSGARPLDVLQVGHIEGPMAVRLGCGGGHLVEYDGALLTVLELPNWSSMAMIGIAGVVVMGLYSKVFASLGKQ